MPKILMSSRDKYINNLDAGIEVVWRNKKYITGNRRHGWVELYKQGKLIRIAKIKTVLKSILKEIKNAKNADVT